MKSAEVGGVVRTLVLGGFLVGSCACHPAPLPAQSAPLPAQPVTPEQQPVPLFSETTPIEVTLETDLSALDGDRSASPDRPAKLTLYGDGGRTVELDIEVRTRGQFRLETCSFPPLRLDFEGADATGTVFEGQEELKLVGSCRPPASAWQELVTKEYLAYRTTRAVAAWALGVRRLLMTFVDTSGEREPETREVFVIEDDDAAATRLGARVFELEEGKNLPAEAFDPTFRMTNAVAQYMVGNPDWSDIAGHNVEIFDRGGVALVVPYDFDFSGLVDAPYATPPPEYRLTSVRERYYRGWCENPITTARVLDRFRAARDSVIAIWEGAEGLSQNERRRSIAYLEDFFDDIETDERAERRFLRDCRQLGGADAERSPQRLAGRVIPDHPVDSASGRT